MANSRNQEVINLRELWEKCGRVYVNQRVFNKCFSTIEDWININGLMSHLMAHELVVKPKHMTKITNPFLTPDQRMQHLLDHIGTCGRHAYFLLYVCLFESREENLGHGDACEELKAAAREMGVKAPWENTPEPALGASVQESQGAVEDLPQHHGGSLDVHRYPQHGESVERDSGSPLAAAVNEHGHVAQVQDEGDSSRMRYVVPTRSSIVQLSNPAAESDDGGSRPIGDPLMPYVASTSNSRGLALIINNHKFSVESGLSERVCGPLDGEKLEETLKKCGYRIRNEVNKTAEEIRSIFDQLLPLKTTTVGCSVTDGIVHMDDDSFVCCVVSHGYWDKGRRQDFVYGSDGKPVSIQELALDNLNVPPGSNRQNFLKQKPKLFFVHACRGTELTLVSADDDKSGSQPLPALPQVNLFPLSADFLFSYPVVPGTKAFRNDESGTFFVDILCQMIDKLREKLDVEPILKRVHYELTSKQSTAYNYKNDQGEVVTVRHCPQVISTLRGPFFFTKVAEERYRKHID